MVCDKRKQKGLLGILVILILLNACEKQEAYLAYSPIDQGPSSDYIERSPAPTATPFQFIVSPIVGTPFAIDNSGIAIIDRETHFYKYYISFSDIRIYEEDEHCYLDAICTNGYDKPLTGECIIVFYDQEGRTCGKGVLHDADSMLSLTLLPGDNRIYSEIASEMDISACPFEFEAISTFTPNE